MTMSSRSSPSALRLAIEHLVADVVLDETAQFLRTRRALPGAGEAVCQVLDPRRGNDDLRRLRLLAADQIEEAEQRRPEHEEVQQRLLQQARHGVYQIGDVNARSCVTIGTFGAIRTLKRLAS